MGILIKSKGIQACEKTIGKTNNIICNVGTLFDLLKLGTLKLLSNKGALTLSKSRLSQLDITKYILARILS